MASGHAEGKWLLAGPGEGTLGTRHPSLHQTSKALNRAEQSMAVDCMCMYSVGSAVCKLSLDHSPATVHSERVSSWTLETKRSNVAVRMNMDRQMHFGIIRRLCMLWLKARERLKYIPEYRTTGSFDSG